MAEYELDDIDRGILHALQDNAREATIEAMGESVGVSASTVRNRINDMEDAGVIEGYYSKIDYEKAGYDLHVLYLCRVPTEDRSQLAREILGASGVVGVHEVLDSNQNIVVEVVASDSDQMATTHDALIELGVDVLQTEYVRQVYVQPLDHFAVGADDE